MSLGRVAPGRTLLRRDPAPGEVDDHGKGSSTARFLALVCCATAVIRLAYVWMPLRSDEAGYLLAARHWAPGAGQFVYGHYQVDRPPLLMAIYRFAALFESDAAVRVITIPFVIVGILALGRAGMLLAGSTGARCSAVVGAAMLCNPAFAGDQADGELFATVFVAGSVAATMRAWNEPRPSVRAPWGGLAGALAAAAVLVKQNFADGFVFAGVLLLAYALSRRFPGRAASVATSGAFGAVAVIAVAWGWALAAEVDLARAWADLVRFRGDALTVIWQGNLEAPASRGAWLLVFAVVGLVLPIVGTWLRWLRTRHCQPDPEHWALTMLMAYSVWSILFGGSYWPHYLLQMTTPIALAAGVVAAAPGSTGRLMRRLANASVVSALLCWSVLIGAYVLVPYAGFPRHIGHWLRDSATPDDTVFVAYGYPGVVESADLSSPYPYLWSLPMRTLDPDQRLLRQTLSGPDAPTWFVKINSLNSWDIDSDGRLRELVDARYDHVADVCGHEVYLRVGVERQFAPLPTC